MHPIRLAVGSTALIAAVSLSVTVISACAEASPPTQPGDTYVREVHGGRLLQSPVSAPGSAAGIDVELSLARASRELADAVGELDASDFSAAERRTVQSPSGARVTFVGMQQVVEDVPIRGAYLNLTLRADADAAPRALVAGDYHLYHAPSVDVVPEVDSADAIARARLHLRADDAAPLGSVELGLFPIDGELQLGWDVTVSGHEQRAVVFANGDERGRVLVVDDRLYEASGTVSGYVSMGGAPGGSGSPELVPLSSLLVQSGEAVTHTAVDGSFTLDGATGAEVVAGLSGVAARVLSKSGANLSVRAPTADGLELSLGASDERSLAQVTAYHYVTSSRQFMVDNGAPAESLGDPLTTNVNIADTCNAYYSPAARTVNFLRSGGGCRNSAEASIIAHEYGHFVDDVFGGIGDGGLSEGWGDTLACFLLQGPVVGGDLLQTGMLRSCDNDYRYPASGSDEVHELGQAWAGFAWHVREALIGQYGEQQGDARARALMFPALVSNASDIPSAVRTVIIVDDDDGDLSNGTPHWDLLRAAAERHALDFVFDTDLTAPAAVTDLVVTATSPTTVSVRWTATGDDGGNGTAAVYDLRYAAAPITESSFSSGIAIPMPDPIEAGSSQHTTAEVSPGAVLYFALEVADEAGNRSGLSNVAAVELPEPAVVFTDGAEAGLGAWQATGLWHITQRASAGGDSSFWYGREDTGTYDTGAANSGTLVSPVIDLAGVDNPKLSISQRIQVEDDASYDRLEITVYDVDDPGVAVVAKKTTGSTAQQFRPRLISLAGLSGRRVRIRFTFDTGDGTANATEGWFVDDLRVLADAAPPAKGVLMINEVLADPPSDYDANRDGVYSFRDDEFIELLNAGAAPIDLSRATVSDGVRTRLEMPPGTVLHPGDALLIFGGGAPQFGGVATLVADGLFLNNGGDVIRIRSENGDLLVELTYGPEGGANQSLSRQNDGDPLAPFVLHTTLAAQPASPGASADGTPFGDPGPAPQPMGQLLINEVLADPPPDFDANGDGHYHYHEDEFIELVNVGASTLDLSGATISDAVGVRTTLAPGMQLMPGEVLVVFGGGAPAISLPNVTAVASNGPLQLNNGGDAVVIRDAVGGVLASVVYGQNGGSDQSLVRAMDLDPDAPFVLHTEVSNLVASPGLRSDGSSL